jgi:deazaflavin-dependent oxidoreductase (nitroreductase family)
MIERYGTGRMPESARRPPRWLPLANRLNIALLSHGIGPATQRILTIAGRVTGIPRSTPIATVEWQGAVYLVAGYANAQWVKNARAMGRGSLSRGASTRSVTLAELPAAERVPVLREFLRTVRGGRAFVTAPRRPTDEQLREAATRHPVFRAH